MISLQGKFFTAMRKDDKCPWSDEKIDGVCSGEERLAAYPFGSGGEDVGTVLGSPDHCIR